MACYQNNLLLLIWLFFKTVVIHRGTFQISTQMTRGNNLINFNDLIIQPNCQSYTDVLKSKEIFAEWTVKEAKSRAISVCFLVDWQNLLLLVLIEVSRWMLFVELYIEGDFNSTIWFIMINLEICYMKDCYAGKYPIAHYVFSQWHRISPSKDIKKIAKYIRQSYLN